MYAIRSYYENTQVGIGEGYVGTCFRDAETLIIRNVPENYVSLKSGLGAVSPKMVCLIPIKQRENIQGVIEIASLKEIEDYKISFIEKISENITANISIQKATEQMNLLLDQSQQQTVITSYSIHYTKLYEMNTLFTIPKR